MSQDKNKTCAFSSAMDDLKGMLDKEGIEVSNNDDSQSPDPSPDDQTSEHPDPIPPVLDKVHLEQDRQLEEALKNTHELKFNTEPQKTTDKLDDYIADILEDDSVADLDVSDEELEATIQSITKPEDLLELNQISFPVKQPISAQAPATPTETAQADVTTQADINTTIHVDNSTAQAPTSNIQASTSSLEVAQDNSIAMDQALETITAHIEQSLDAFKQQLMSEVRTKLEAIYDNKS